MDYLVIGSKPATGWKYGDYGIKIQKALELSETNPGRPMLVSEIDFMEALVKTPCFKSRDIDLKIIVCNYTFTVPNKKESFAYESDLYGWFT